MREILFRGKWKDNGEWIEGFCAKACDKSYIVRNKHATGVLFFVDEVIPETVGQYTGLDDKNGKRIFEGDILSCVNEDGKMHYITVVFEDCAFLIEDSGIIDSDLLTSYVCLGLTVVGNIHDNPELLEVDNG